MGPLLPPHPLCLILGRGCGAWTIGHPLGLGSYPVSVPALTQKPDVYVPKTLEPGHQVALICVFNPASEECLVPTFSWKGAALSSQETSPRTSRFSVLTLTPRPQDHNTDLTCRVDFSRKGVSAERTVRLNVACESGRGLSGSAGR